MKEADKMIGDHSRLSGLILILIAAQIQSSGSFQEETSWTSCLPQEVQAGILWTADHEEGTLFDWEYDRNPENNGGGIFNTGNASEAIVAADQTRPFTGKYCVKATIHNAIESQSGAKAVRLMRWTDRPWDQGGKNFPASAYYGVWMRLDHNYSTRNSAENSGGWWNVFQFKSNDEAGESQRIWVLNIGNNQQSGEMQFYLYSDLNEPRSISQETSIPVPLGRWFHLEAFYQQSGNNASDGSLSVWQDGQLILKANNVKTVLANSIIWGIGNYTDHISGGTNPGEATIYFDDATISKLPTHPYVEKMLDAQRRQKPDPPEKLPK